MAPEAVLRHLLFCAALAGLSAAIVAAMIRIGVLDQPVARSSHTRPTPKGGGVGVVAAFLVGIVALYAFADFARIADPYFRAVIGASLGIAVVSYLDDVRSWPFSVKLATQAVAALVAVGSGLAPHELRVPWIGTVAIGWLGVPATVGWILVLTNAVNFIDGLNGLAAGSVAIACLFLAVIAAGQGDWFVYFAAAILAAGVLGFLPFNFPRARIFMGDVGSQFCGFTLAVLGVAAGRFAAVELSLLLMPMLLAGVLFDVAFTLARRLLTGRRITQAHRGHLYQVANRCGMNAAAVTLVYWGFVVWGGVSCGRPPGRRPAGEQSTGGACVHAVLQPWPAHAAAPGLRAARPVGVGAGGMPSCRLALCARLPGEPLPPLAPHPCALTDRGPGPVGPGGSGAAPLPCSCCSPASPPTQQ